MPTNEYLHCFYYASNVNTFYEALFTLTLGLPYFSSCACDVRTRIYVIKGIMLFTCWSQRKTEHYSYETDVPHLHCAK